MKYVYPDTAHWAAGWILSNTNDGAWLTLRKATENDVSRITKASGFRQDGPAQTSQKQSSAAVPVSDVKP